MADPISLAGTAVGVVSLGIQVANGIHGYINLVRGRGDDLAIIANKVESVKGALAAIKKLEPKLQAQGLTGESVAAADSSLNSCKDALEDLENFLEKIKLKRRTESFRDKLKDAAKGLSYPFDKANLDQLSQRLDGLTASLGTALHSLQLDGQNTALERLTVINTTSDSILIHTSDMTTVLDNLQVATVGTQNQLDRLSTTTEAVVGKLSTQNSKLSTVGRRVNNLETMLIASAIAHSKQLTAAERLLQEVRQQLISRDSENNIQKQLLQMLAKPGYLRSICDELDVDAEDSSQNESQSIRAITRQKRLIKRDAKYRQCSCLGRKTRDERSTALGMGTFLFSNSTETYHAHSPGCSLHIPEPSRTVKRLGLAFTGLSKFLSKTISISCSLTSGAGGCAISPNLMCLTVVDGDQSPAFQVIYRAINLMRSLWDVDEQVEVLEYTAMRLDRLFRERQAFPLEIDDEGNTLMHVLSHYLTSVMGDQNLSEPFIEIFKLLDKFRVPMNGYNIYGQTPVTLLLEYVTTAKVDNFEPSQNTFRLGASLYDLGVDLPAKAPPLEWQSEWFLVLDTLLSNPIYGEVYGCGPLGMAILHRDSAEVKRILNAFPNSIKESNWFHHNVFHLAITWPAGLRILLGSARTRLNDLDQAMKPAWVYAAAFSSRFCQTGNGREICERDCECTECLELLLEADCAMGSPNELSQAMADSSLKAAKLIASHFKQRRDRLKEMALRWLPKSQTRKFELDKGPTLDVHYAEVLTALLKTDFCVPEALSCWNPGERYYVRTEKLKPPSACTGRGRDSVYFVGGEIKYFDVMWEAGFQQIVLFDDEDLSILHRFVTTRECLVATEGAVWLFDHGLEHQLSLGSKTDSFRIGRDVAGIYRMSLNVFVSQMEVREEMKSPQVPVPSPELLETYWSLEKPRLKEMFNLPPPEQLKALFEHTVSMESCHECYCGCGPDGCEPLKDALQEFVQVEFEDDVPDYRTPASKFSTLLYCFPDDEKARQMVVRMGIRNLTFNTLEIKHLCCIESYVTEVEERLEFFDEDKRQLEDLELLMFEFEAEITKSGCNYHDFIEKYWVERMDEYFRQQVPEEAEQLAIRELGIYLRPLTIGYQKAPKEDPYVSPWWLTTYKNGKLDESFADI